MLPLLAAALLAQNREETLGKSNAQILAMGRKAWVAFYLSKQGDSTAAMSGASGTYGDAVAWRTDRLLKGRKSPLRAHMRDFSNDAQGVGAAITGGGTIWNIVAADMYADTEEAFYAVLTYTGRAPKRVVSDVEKEIEKLRKGLHSIDEAKYRIEGRDSMRRLDADFRAIVTDAKRLPRRDSDAVLEFCRSVAAGVAEQAGPG